MSKKTLRQSTAFKDQSLVLPVVQMCGFDTVQDFADFIQKILVQDIQLELTEAEVEQWAKEFSGMEHRLVRHPEPIGYEEIRGIYMRALKSYIKG